QNREIVSFSKEWCRESFCPPDGHQVKAFDPEGIVLSAQAEGLGRTGESCEPERLVRCRAQLDPTGPYGAEAIGIYERLAASGATFSSPASRHPNACWRAPPPK